MTTFTESEYPDVSSNLLSLANELRAFRPVNFDASDGLILYEAGYRSRQLPFDGPFLEFPIATDDLNEVYEDGDRGHTLPRALANHNCSIAYSKEIDGGRMLYIRGMGDE